MYIYKYKCIHIYINTYIYLAAAPIPIIASKYWFSKKVLTHKVPYNANARNIPCQKDDAVYLDKLQTKGVKKSILYM
jgi:hypothetical protein